MKRVTVAILIICMVGCTTLRPITGRPSDLQQGIAFGELLKSGDRVKIETIDNKVHQFTVTSIEPNVISGQHESIAIDQIASIQKREFDLGHTVKLIGFTILGIIVIAVAVGLKEGAGLPAGG